LTLKNIELEKAIKIINESVNPINSMENIKLKDGIGRILSKDYYADIDNPPFDRSPLDGFALRSIDTLKANKDNPIDFKVIDTVYAGNVSNLELGKNECIRIMTGAKMPLGSDCVIRLEDVVEENNSVKIDISLSQHENYVFKGEDIEKGDLLIEKNTKLNSVHLGILGSMGKGNIEVFKKPKIGILGTGDELIPYNKQLTDGKIYDTNGTMIGGRLKELGYEHQIIETSKDDPYIVGDTILDNINNFDLILTTGGVSVGDKDIFHDVIDIINGDQKFWKVKIKPGTPVMYSLVKGKPILSLSGNPFAALTTFELLGRPLISKLCKDETIKPKKVTGILENEFPKDSLKMRRFVRCLYKEGKVYLPESDHSSGKMLSMIDCNGILDMKKGMKNLKTKDEIEVFLL